MNSFKMKTLSLAVLGLTGFALAGTASAACPAGATTANGGAWSSQSVSADETLSIVSPGLNGTSCALQIVANTTLLPNTKGYVTDNSPQNEPRYRARFYIDLSSLTNLNSVNQQFEIFDAFANTAPGTNGTDEVQVFALGNTAIRFLVADTSVASGSKAISVTLPSSATKNYRIEFDLQTSQTSGTAGSFRYWVTDAATVTSDTSPTGTYAPLNYGWSGILAANLGLYSTSANFRTQVAGPTQSFRVDEFDSRRSTFIGL